MGSIADKIKLAQDKDGMLRRALERIIQLYTDRSHFVYELLQNAEDAEATQVEFIQYPDRLEVLHDGRPFTTENLQGLCDIGKSDKVDNLNQIGEFGVGFKSVFGICDTVLLYSKPKNFRGQISDTVVPFAVKILDFTSPKDIPEDFVEYPYTTKFVFPYTVGKTFSGFKSIAELNDTLSRKLQNLGITTLLFMKNLELIKYRIELDHNPIEGQYLLEKEIINDHCYLVSALGVSEVLSSKTETFEEVSYLKFSRTIDDKSSRTVDIAFPITIDATGQYECLKPKDPYISVYFPTETESKLGFVVQGPYRTTPNRSSIPADDEDNIRLAAITAELLRDTIRELRDSGKLNMSFVKALPLSIRSFDNYKLFYPLYETVKSMFLRERIIPTKDGNYVTAQNAKIARQERLANIFSDDLLSSLINDGSKYHWLPTYLTETNREYELVYRYLTSELKVTVVRPEDLRIYFNSNPGFLIAQTDDWIVNLYLVLENVAAAFSKARNETNMLTANIIKTSTGEFVAAYRKTESKQYIPNVFLPTPNLNSSDIYFVDSNIYAKCRHFFDNILQLQKPNEYELIIKDIRKRYSGTYVFHEDKHIEDIKHLYKYLKYEDYRGEVRSLIKNEFLIRCSDGTMRNPFASRIFLPLSPSGINIESYFKNVAKDTFYVDIEFYYGHGISYDILIELGARSSILTNETIERGVYFTGNGGRQPEWWTAGDFRWKLSIEYLNEVVQYIAEHPSRGDSIIKSKTIMAILFENESKLLGTVRIGGATPNLDNEPCEAIRILRKEKSRNWNGKWLFTQSMELVAPKDISKHDISKDIYGNVKSNSIVYELLKFKKTADDKVDDLKKVVPKEQLDAFFEAELRNRFGVSSSDLSKHFDVSPTSNSFSQESEEQLIFPTSRVKNWETLRKHAAEMLCYANPVKYEYAVRKIRVSNRPKEIKSYLMGAYRYEGSYKFACQMCHDSTTNFESTQLFNGPETELDPMYLCLCPNCAAEYRHLRGNEPLMDAFKQSILNVHESAMSGEDHISIPLDLHRIWFTQIHLAEIQTLIRLKNEVKLEKNLTANIEETQEDIHAPQEEIKQSNLSIYNEYIGKKIKRNDGFIGEVVRVDSTYLHVKVINKGKRGRAESGSETKFQLAFVLAHPNDFQFS